MIYNGTYSCGHEGRTQIYGTDRHGERERKAEYHFSGLCPECEKARQQETNKKYMADNNLPEFTVGSEKQVAWAHNLRRRFDNMMKLTIENERIRNTSAHGYVGWLKHKGFINSDYDGSWVNGTYIELIDTVRKNILYNVTDSNYYINTKEEIFASYYIAKYLKDYENN